jgi:signal transduction histidine kinase
MRLSERQLNILVGTALAALLPLAWLQYRWISEVSEAEEQRRAVALRVTLERIAVETDRAAGLLHAAVFGPAGRRGVPLEDRLAAYQPDDDDLPVRRILRFTEDNGRWRAEAWDPAAQRLVPVETPAWWSPGIRRNGPIVADPPALLGDLGAVAVELDGDRIRNDFLPRLLQRYTGNGYLEDFTFRIVPVADPPAGDARVGLFRRPLRGRLAELPAFRKKGRLFGAAPEGADGIWRLEASHQSGALSTVAARTRTRNLAVSGVTLLFLAGALLALGHALRRAQRLAAMQLEFTAGVSHELRTPLAVIVSAGDNLAGGYVADPAKVREYGALVRDEGTRLTGMVDQVLRFSQFESGRVPLTKHPVTLSSVLATLEREGIPFTAAAEDATFPADAAALHVALRNLLENAVRHGGGQQITVRASKQGATVEFAVEDRGPGIAPADLPHLFEPFYRGAASRAEQRKGSGLGLALVDRVARAHGGSVRAENVPGGARFTLTLPSE